jgi:hypothetical protein
MAQPDTIPGLSLPETAEMPKIGVLSAMPVIHHQPELKHFPPIPSPTV